MDLELSFPTLYKRRLVKPLQSSKSITHKGVFHIEYIYTGNPCTPKKSEKQYLLHLQVRKHFEFLHPFSYSSYSFSSIYIFGNIVDKITLKPIPSRKWKDKKDRWELVVERDKNRKRNQQIVDERIHYIWFHYLQLCLNLEEIKYSVPKRGGGGKIISTNYHHQRKSYLKKRRENLLKKPKQKKVELGVYSSTL